MSGTCDNDPPSLTVTERPRPVNRALGHACRYVLAAVFLMAAVTKITDLPGFADRLVLHSALPPRLAEVVAFVLPWLELTCGLCLVFGMAVREAAAILCVLLLAFLGLSLSRPAEPDCGCLILPRLLKSISTGPWVIIRDFVLLLCGLHIAAGSKPSGPPANTR
jgi:uncharacterized membrane protein YphA (DoxX/SURF4 family)